MNLTRPVPTLVVDLADAPHPTSDVDAAQVSAEASALVAQIERAFGDTPALQAQRRAAVERDA